MSRSPQIHSDIPDPNFENEEQAIESAEKAVRLEILIFLVLVGLVALLAVGSWAISPVLQAWPFLTPVIPYLLLGLFFGGLGFTLWKLSRS